MNLKTTLTSFIGTTVEWAEFCFYGYLVTQLSPLFFPMLSPDIAIIAGFGAFAASYLARPLGGIFFGHIGDKWGRKKAFAGSILLMSVATFGIGLLPVYDTIGILAPILLVLLRFFQGLATGGEYPGASVFIIEHNRDKPYFAASWVATAAAVSGLDSGAAAAT